MTRDDATRRASVRDSRDEGYVIVFARGGAIAPLPLPSSGEAILGREAPAELVVPDDSVSRRHARIHGGSPPEIEDLESTNGTKVMGRRLLPKERIALSYGSIVELGTVVAFVQPKTNDLTASSSDAVRSRPTTAEPRTEARVTVPPPAITTNDASVRSPVLRDATMIRLYELVDIIAPSKLSILILGETGVGKDVYAETVHARSPRGSGRFVRLNCAALPESLLEAELFGYERGAFTGAMQAKPGLFESADGGTVFLDEIGEMPLVTQAKLLRVLENGEVLRIGSLKPKRVDVRFVSATNRDLESLSATGQFRSDLYFRLNGVSVALPPLRRRPDDVLPLAEMFLRGAGGAQLSEAAAAELRAYRWPGNIRELKNVVERAALLAQGKPIRPEHLLFRSAALSDVGVPAPPASAPSAAPAPDPSAGHASAGMTIRDEFAELERARILEAMEKCGGNQSRAAKMLGISRTTLIKRLESYQYVRPRKGQDDA